jgi:hypothetical protein
MLAFLFVLLLPSLAHAAENDADEDDASDDVRPIQYASLEVNPLGLAVERYGGQAQVAIMGPLTLVGGMSRIESAAVRGWAMELGSRLFFGLAPRRTDGTRIAHVFLAASFLADDLRVGDTRGERRGVAIDVGIHARIAHGFYALGGVGIAHRSTDLVIPDRFEQMATTPRLLLGFGWGI